MTSLSEAYDTAAGQNPGRLYLGVTLFLVGALFVIAGIVVTTTNVLQPSLNVAEVRLYGGVLAGVGVPAVFLGVFTVLPSGRQTRAAAVIGASISLLGVALFWHAYPCQWIGANCGQDLTNLTLPTVGVYFLGTITTFWCLFVGAANFKTRNDPGGTVKMEVTRQGETKVIEVPAAQAKSFGGVGLFGNEPDGEVETQTAGSNKSTQSTGSSSRSSRSSRSSSPQPSSPTSATVSDGGAADTDIRSPLDETGDAEVMTTESPKQAPSRGDAYCGSCAHFQYVRGDSGMVPYCGYHEEVMDDMAACQEWTGRNQQ
ncbi:hypothetical protein SAMN04487949_0924 [Halogranum gelatinilyticum]|uniref:Uncharacterized protein n=1 Tax=Halogranum gelatinilyticum TaxID=660521 RepID=A0A1G9QMZ1_9EURY|nr:ribonuclease BN [Halogranum gelatinilyticum]SDM11927.1 hypothetical protein SAMN04487949_0924 [Halogranum gelatinilyticum]